MRFHDLAVSTTHFETQGFMIVIVFTPRPEYYRRVRMLSRLYALPPGLCDRLHVKREGSQSIIATCSLKIMTKRSWI